MSLSLARKRRIRDDVNDSHQNDGDVPTRKRRMENGEYSQLSVSQSQRLEDSRRCGKLLRMHLTNFMCHSNLSVEFHPRVNFLVGSNGSGKSAVLAALVLGLGGSAKTTNRSRSAKAFIKTGESTAKIEIVMCNDGPQPYEPEVYGDKITVVRTITSTSGSYVIKDSQGHVVSKKVDDLHRILMYHNVQVDNPVFVLNQDSAREFLKDLEPSKNYNLFLKATQIDVVMEKLNESLHLHRTHVNELKNYRIKLEKEREDISEHKSKLEEFLTFEKLKDVLKRMEVEYAWLLVKQYEDKIQEIDTKLTKYEKEERKLQHAIQNKDEFQREKKGQIKKNDEAIALKNNEYEKEHRQYMQIQNNVDEVNKALTDITISQESLKKKKSRLEKQIEDTKKYIAERSEGNQEDVDALRAQNQQLISEYRSKCTNHIDPKIENLRREQKLYIDSKTQKEELVNEMKRIHRECTEKIRLKNSQIENVKASVKDKLLIYGDHMPSLINDIKKVYSQGNFSKLPKGPIGSYVEVPNSAYRDAVENAIGVDLLGAFLVNTSKDGQILKKIFAKYNNKRPIITAAFSNEVYNVSSGCVNPIEGTTLLLDEITCNDPTVMNCLIDRRKIESILLTDSKEMAESITSVRKNVPKNLTKVLVLRDRNFALEYFPMPNYRMYSTKIKQANFIQVNIEERISQLETEKLSWENKLQNCEVDLKRIIHQIPQDVKLIKENLALLEKQEIERRELLEKISELENVEYADYSNEIEILKNEIEETAVRLEEVETKLKDTCIQVTDKTSEKTKFQKELISKKSVLDEIQNEIESYKAISDKIKMELRSASNNDSHNQNKLIEIQETLKKISKEKKEMEKNFKIYMRSAVEKGERIETELSQNEIEDEIAKIKAKLKHGMPTNYDPQSLRELIATKEEALEASQGSFENIRSSIESLRKSLKFRFDFLKKFKGHMALLLQLSFNMLLKLRNFEGTLDVNDQEKTLTISVIPRDHNKNAVSSTKSLSGGERSYSTVAFLISLWSCVDHPFYFLDEYDVFTDEVNREYMTRLLVDEGRKRPLRQYSFLTPQDMSLMSEDFIKIFRMGDPDRR